MSKLSTFTVLPIAALLFFNLAGCESVPPPDSKLDLIITEEAALEKDRLEKQQAQNEVARLRYTEITTEANNLLDQLTTIQRKSLLYSYQAPGRTGGFCYVLDQCKDQHQGLRLQDLSGHQKIHLHRFLMKALSGAGYAKAIQTLNREWIIEEMEDAHRAMPSEYPVVGDADGSTWTPPVQRGEPRYYIAIFGKPSPENPWSIRFEGHHLSLNLTFSNKNTMPQIGITPMFFGSSPMIIPQAPKEQNSNYKTWQHQEGQQLLARESWLAKSFIRQLDKITLNKGEWYHLPAATLDGGTDVPLNVDKYTRQASVGIERKDLTATENVMLQEFVEEFLNNHTTHHRRQITQASLNNTKVWWYGNPNDDQAEFYVRVQAGEYLIELLQSNTYGVLSEVKANHVHASVRHLTQDWDFDPLAAHIKRHH